MWDEIDFPTALLKTHSIEMALYKHTYQLWSFCFFIQNNTLIKPKTKAFKFGFYEKLRQYLPSKTFFRVINCESLRWRISSEQMRLSPQRENDSWNDTVVLMKIMYSS